MPIICLVTQMRAPIDRCFDLARSIEIHLRSTEKTREKVVGRTTNGLLKPQRRGDLGSHPPMYPTALDEPYNGLEPTVSF